MSKHGEDWLVASDGDSGHCCVGHVGNKHRVGNGEENQGEPDDEDDEEKKQAANAVLNCQCSLLGSKGGVCLESRAKTEKQFSPSNKLQYGASAGPQGHGAN